MNHMIAPSELMSLGEFEEFDISMYEEIKLQPSKRREGVMKRLYPDLYAYLHSGKFDDFETHSLKVTKFIYGGGYCLACNTRTNIWSGKGFYEFCNKTCASKVKTYGEQNKLNLDRDQVRKMYIDDKMTPKAIGEVLNCSHVSVLKVVTEMGIKRTHSEQQSLYSARKGKPAINAGDFDRDKAFDINFITKENETKSIALIASELGCSASLLLQQLQKHNIKVKNNKITIPEKTIQDFLISINVEFIENYRDVQEIDIYIPKYNIGIEVDGVYWHSEKFRSNDYHIVKTKYFADKGITILHFWDFEVIKQLDIVQDIIKSKLGITDKIYARKCVVQDVDVKDARDFCNNNHIQGYSNSSIKKGLYFKDELVALATFAKPRFDNDHDLELIRFCSKNGTTVVGGFSKLLSKINSTSIMSYANLRFSTGNVYEKNGFKYVRTSKPGFFWYHVNTGEISKRLSIQRPWQEMQQERVYRVFDCGNNIYSMK